MNKRFVKGMAVRIKGITETHERFQSDSIMKGMVGEIFKLQHVSSDYVRIDGYTWSISDIEVATPPIKNPKSNGKETYFDETTLITGV